MKNEELSSYLWEELQSWGELREQELENWETEHPEYKIPPDLDPEGTLFLMCQEVERRKKAMKKPLTGSGG